MILLFSILDDTLELLKLKGLVFENCQVSLVCCNVIFGI